MADIRFSLHLIKRVLKFKPSELAEYFSLEKLVLAVWDDIRNNYSLTN